MTKHTMVTFQLHRKGVILVVILSIVLAVLLAGAGFFAGVARGRKAAAAAAPKPAAPKKAAAAAPRTNQESFTLRVALLPTEEEASAEVKRLKIRRIAATVVPAETRDSVVVYEIHVGTYPDRRTALAAADSMQKDHGLPSAVVPSPLPPL